MHNESHHPSPASKGKQTVCPRYEVIYEYIRITGRPLTNLERRAFLYMLDLDADERYTHSDDGECVCMDILPAIVQALDPDPVDAVVAERNLDGEICPAQRYHTECVGKNQGIVLKQKTQREHTTELRKLLRKQLRDADVIVKELLRRPRPEYSSDRAMLEGEFPELFALAKLTQQTKRQVAQKAIEPVTLTNAGQRLEVTYHQASEKLTAAFGTLAAFIS